MPSIRNPYFPAIANTWTQMQTQGSHSHSYTQQNNYEDLPNNSSVTWQFGGFGQFSIGGTSSSANIQVINYNGSKTNRISLGVVPSASNPTIASGTIYQNTTARFVPLTSTTTSQEPSRLTVAEMSFMVFISPYI